MKIPLAFITVIIIWSTTPLAIQWSSTGAPFSSLSIRMLIGMLFCLSLIHLLKVGLATHKKALWLYFASGISIYLSMVLVYWAAQRIPSGWIAVLFGLSPIITGLLSALIEPEQAITRLKLLGTLLGITGLSFIFITGLTFDQQSLVGLGVIVMAVFVTSASSVWIRQLSKHQTIPGLAITTGGLVLATPLFIITAFISGDIHNIAFSNLALSSIVYLGIVGSGFGFTLYYFLLKNISAARVALITLVTPVTGLLVGHWLNNEPLIGQIWLGTACICLGLICYEYKPKLGLRGLQ